MKRRSEAVVDGLGEWHRVGQRLAVVDPARFRRLLSVAQGMVAAYDGAEDLDSSADLHALLVKMASSSGSFDA